jgi:hypothetical protein
LTWNKKTLSVTVVRPSGSLESTWRKQVDSADFISWIYVSVKGNKHIEKPGKN